MSVDLLREAAAAGIRLRLDGQGRIKVQGRPEHLPPDLLARLRAARDPLDGLLAGQRCRHCGTAVDWSRPGAVAFADGLAAHLRCHVALNSRQTASSRSR